MRKLGLLLAGVAMTLLLVGVAVAAEKTYVNGIDFGFPPFGFVDKDGKPSGFDVEAVNWIANKKGFKVKHQPMDWDGIIPALLAGKIDFVASGMSATAERNELVDFTIPYYVVTQVLLVRPDEAMNLDQLLTSGKTLGVQRGTVTAALLEGLVKKPGYKFTLKQYDSTDLSMQDLPIGRIDGSGMDSSIAKELMKNGSYKIAGTFDALPENYGYAVREEDNELLKTLNQGLIELMADPYWEQLKAKWGL